MLLFSPKTFIFSLLSNNLKIETYRTVILLYGCETWSLNKGRNAAKQDPETNILAQEE
jgi:hypothetical protein